MMMTHESERACFVARVREVLEQGLGLTEVDDDGDWVLRGETSRGWVRPIATGPGGVAIEMVAAMDVPSKAAVLRELNDLNARHPAVRFARTEQALVVATWFLLADAVTVPAMVFAIGQVRDAADHLGPMLVAVHGGVLPHQPTTELEAREA